MAHLACLLLSLCGVLAHAHEVRPAVLRITEHADRRLEIFWRQPSDGSRAVHLEPRLSGGLLDRPPDENAVQPDAQSSRWRDVDPGPTGLDNRVVSVTGLEQTLVEALVIVQRADGTTSRAVLRARSPSVTLYEASRPSGVGGYLLMGMRHILSGPDHLLFILALVLIVRNPASLIKTVTAFTVAHSITLVASTLGALQWPAPLIDTLIALSILFVAPDVLQVARGAPNATARRPWLTAFCFGLLHGLGFSTGLSTTGLTHHELLQALVLFNCGVELGQLAFITFVLLLIAALRRLPVALPRPALAVPAYVIGGAAAYWVIESAQQLFTVG